MDFFSNIRYYFVWAVVILAALPIMMWILKNFLDKLYAIAVPEEKFDATIVSRRIEVKTKESKVKTICFVTFELNDGERMVFETDFEDYALNVEGDRGKLALRKAKFLWKYKHKGEWNFVSFDRK